MSIGQYSSCVARIWQQFSYQNHDIRTPNFVQSILSEPPFELILDFAVVSNSLGPADAVD